MLTKLAKPTAACVTALVLTILLAPTSGSGAVPSDDSGPPVLFSAATASDELDTPSLEPFETKARLAEFKLRSPEGEIDIPDVIEIELFVGERHTVQVVDRQSTLDGMRIWSGRTRSSPLTHGDSSDVTIVIDPVKGEFGASLALADGSYVIKQASGDLYRVSRMRALDLESDIHTTDNGRRALVAPRNDLRAAAAGETDSNGVHVVDILVGFSDAAAARVGNPTLTAQQMISEVNSGLRNSGITSVRLRLVGTATTPHNPGVVGAVIDNAELWFAGDIQRTGADMVAVVQTPGSNDIGGGAATLGGFISVNSIDDLLNVFRHEFGHNAGVLHCSSSGGGPSPYAYGWAVPGRDDIRTHMCGNSINFYSNPNVFVQGHAIGNAQSADAARVWRENAAKMSGHRIHTIPFESDPPPAGSQPVVAKHSGSCLTASGSFGGASVVQAACGGGANQAWTFQDRGNGYSRLVSGLSNLCLDVEGGSRDDEANVIQWSCTNGDNQLWKLEPTADGFNRLVSKHSGKCLDVTGGSRADGANVIQWPCGEGDNQRWKTAPAPPPPTTTTTRPTTTTTRPTTTTTRPTTTRPTTTTTRPPTTTTPVSTVVGGVISNGDGSPAVGAKVDLFEATPSGSRGAFLDSATTGTDGRYSFDTDVGCYVLTFIAPDSATYDGRRFYQPGVCVVGNPVDPVDAKLDAEPEASIGGRVSFADGSPASDIKIDIFEQTDSGDRGQFLGFTSTDSDGRYDFAVNAGCYVLTFIGSEGATFNRSRWYQPTQCVEVGEDVNNVDALFDPANESHLGGTVTTPDGTGASGIKVTFFNSQADGSRGLFLGQTFTNSAGGYAFEVTAGCHWLVFVGPDEDSFDQGQYHEAFRCVDPGETVTDINAQLARRQ